MWSALDRGGGSGQLYMRHDLRLIRVGASVGGRALRAPVQGEMEQSRELWEIRSSCEGDKSTPSGGEGF